MAKKKQNELQLDSIVKQSEQIDELSTYVVDKEKNIVIKYNKEFSEIKIGEMMNELFSHIMYDVENKKGFFVDDETFMIYINFLMIKHFSHLGGSMKNNTLEENVVYIEHLGKTGYFRLFFNEIFEPKEVAKVFEMVRERAEMVEKIKDAEIDLMNQAQKIPSKNKIDEMIEEAVKLQAKSK